jgi:sterol-4alpha-carboxylate 3-dehydrogenase (decarboxylating)
MSAPSTKASLGHVNVVGGCGFLGHHIVKLLSTSHPQTRISVLDLRTSRNRIEGSNISYHDCDITDEAAVNNLYSQLKPDVVVHTASPVFVGNTNEKLFYKVNVDGTNVLLKSAQENGVKAFVYTSSASVIMGKDPTLINANESYPVVAGKEQPEYYTTTKV